MQKPVAQPSGAVANPSVDAKAQPRTYNPIDQAKRGQVGASLNADAAKYKKGPYLE